MTVATFRLTGKFAHWRKFYTNSSSLSYYFPPRTNICGMIASILNLDRDSYYEILNKSNIDIGISICSKVKKKITSLNYLNTKDNKGYTQIKFELLLPFDIRKEVITYEIYLRPKTYILKEKTIELIDNVKLKKLHYGLYFGQRPFKADIEYIDSSQEEEVENATNVSTVCPNDKIKGDLVFDENTFYTYEIIPIDFNIDREIQKTEKVIASINGGQIRVDNGIIEDVFRINGNKNITFL